MFRRLREDIKSIIERDPAARNAWEVLTCYPGISGHSRSQGFALVLESRPEMVRPVLFASGENCNGYRNPSRRGHWPEGFHRSWLRGRDR